MTQEMKYENWFLVHSGLQKPVNPTKGGFLLAVSGKLHEVVNQIEVSQPPKEAPKEKEKEKEKGDTIFEKWFYRNCDNNNIPDLSTLVSHDYVDWFLKHSVKKAPEPKYSSPYEAWFHRNKDNRNVPDLAKINSHNYENWFAKHSTKTVAKPDNSYEAWFERNRDSKNPGVIPEPVLTYEQWFEKHCIPSAPVKSTPQKQEPYTDWFSKHSK